MKNSKGFTLIELLAVIAVLALLVLISVPMIARYVRDGRNLSNDTTLKSAEDAAVTYALENRIFIKDDCAKSNIIDKIVNDGCVNKVSIQNLIKNGYLKDSASKLKENGEVIIYKYKNNGNYELKAYADKSLLK